MRRLWLTLLTAFALIAGGFAGTTASACPMEQTVAVSHDCCPDSQTSHPQAPQDHNMDGCLMGMACAAPAIIQPGAASIPLVHSIVLKHPLANSADAPVGPLQELFRPPRSI